MGPSDWGHVERRLAGDMHERNPGLEGGHAGWAFVTGLRAGLAVGLA